MGENFPIPDPAPTPVELLSWLDGAISDVWYDDHGRRVRIRNVQDGATDRSAAAHLDVVPPDGWPETSLVRYQITIVREGGSDDA